MKGLTVALVFSYEPTSQLRRCVESVLNELPNIQSQVGHVEWILVRTPKGKGKDVSFFPGKVIESNDDNLGANRNRALQMARTEGFYFVDPDCWLEAGSLEILCDAFEREKGNPKIYGFAGPNILNSENLKLDRAFKWLGKTRFINGGLSQITVGSQDRLDWHSPTCHILYNLGHLQDAFFSSRFEKSGEDLDFHFRQSRKNNKILICSNSQVWHEQPRDFFSYLKKSFKYGKAQTFLLKVEPASIVNKRLTALFGSLIWAVLFFSLNETSQLIFLISTIVACVLILVYEVFSYKEEKEYFSFFYFFLLIAGFYLLGQFSGLLTPLPKKQNEMPRQAKTEYS